jgi:hypothetical protein
MTNLHDYYTSKEFNGIYKKFQKAAILFLNGGTSKPLFHRQKMNFWERTKHLHKRKIKNMGR